MELCDIDTALAAYFSDMKKRNRMIGIYKDGNPVGWCTYLVGTWDHVKIFHNRPVFSLMQDMEDGPVIYIDYVVSLRWNREIRDSIYKALKEKHPSFQKGVWYRPTQHADREVVWHTK